MATIRALKYHGGQPLSELTTPNIDALGKGIVNLEKHVENINTYGVPGVVAINKFVTDSEEETNLVMNKCKAMGIRVALCEGWEHGGNGTTTLAEEVVKAVESCTSSYSPVYDWKSTTEEKINDVAKKIYGATKVEFQPKARLHLKKVERLGLGDKPICIAKTQNSFSDNPKLLGRPTGFTVTVREIEIAAGAGFIIPIMGDMLRMPGLPAKPAAEGIDIDEEGKITGLS